MADLAFYQDAAQSAIDAFTTSGQPITLSRPGAGTHYDPATSTVVPDPDVVYHASGFPINFSAGEIRGTEIAFGDVKIYISPDLGTNPKSQDIITLQDGTRYSVVTPSTFNPGGTVIYHLVQARKI